MTVNNFSQKILDSDNDEKSQASLNFFDTEGKNTYALAAYCVIFTVIILVGLYIGFKRKMSKNKEVEEEEELTDCELI